MKRFTFSLDVLLKKRMREEEEIKLELARKNSQIYGAQTELSECYEQLKQLQEEQKATRKTASDVMSLRLSVSFRNKLKMDILKKGQYIQDLQKHFANIQHRLVRATQKRKAIELIRKKRYRQWQKEYKIKEQGFIDDVSQQGFIRNKKVAAKTASA